MNPVVHFEFPVIDKARAVEFYSKVFGWKANILGPEMGGYVVVSTSPSDPNDPSGRPSAPGTINGGFYDRPKDDEWGQHPSVVIAVPDIKKAMSDVVAGGGKIHGDPQDIPGVGVFVSMIDTEGNRVSILQPLPMMPVHAK